MQEEEGLVLRFLDSSDSATLRDESEKEAHRLAKKFRRYLAEQEAGRRSVHVAMLGTEFAGYVTVLWTADDPSFREQGIPEISDLSVNPRFRGRGFGSALLARAEEEVATRFDRVGLNVGLHSGYGVAQRLYVRRGYLLDGSGVVVEGAVVPEGATIRLDDNPIVTLRMTKDLHPIGS